MVWNRSASQLQCRSLEVWLGAWQSRRPHSAGNETRHFRYQFHTNIQTQSMHSNEKFRKKFFYSYLVG